MKQKKRTSKPPFYKQETPDSCAVACLRSVLQVFGHVSDEASLRKLCKTTSSGTLSDDLVKCAHDLGFDAKKEYSDLKRLSQHLTKNCFPILYINLYYIEFTDDFDKYLCVPVSDFQLRAFYDGQIDLREIFTEPGFGKYYYALVSDSFDSDIQLTPLANNNLPEKWLPKSGFTWSDTKMIEEYNVQTGALAPAKA